MKITINKSSEDKNFLVVQTDLAQYILWFESGAVTLTGPGINREHELFEFPKNATKRAVAAYLVAQLESRHYGEN
jgi:hypothetical protein